MDVQTIIASSGGILFVLLTLLQICPLKVNPWSAIGRLIGRAFNAEVMKKLEALEECVAKNQKTMENHIRIDDDRYTDLHRTRILQFNTEIRRGENHTKESFNEILANIDYYERYCKNHPEYENNRAVLAIDRIKEVYKERLEKDDFL